MMCSWILDFVHAGIGGIFNQQGRIPTGSGEIVHEGSSFSAPGSTPFCLCHCNVHTTLSKICGESVIDFPFDSAMRWDLAVLYHQQDLDECRHTGRRLSVSHICLDGSQVKVLIWGSTLVPSKCVQNRLHFYCIASLSSSAVCWRSQYLSFKKNQI